MTPTHTLNTDSSNVSLPDTHHHTDQTITPYLPAYGQDGARQRSAPICIRRPALVRDTATPADHGLESRRRRSENSPGYAYRTQTPRTMPLLAIGLNHKHAPVEVRENVVFNPARLPDALAQVSRLPGVRESAILSTCNRTEIYLNLAHRTDDAIIDWLAAYHQQDPAQLRRHLYRRPDLDMVEHILGVACGLDSMVLGEPQILGQLKDAYRVAQQVGVLGASLERLFQHCFSVAKQVRTDTTIGASPVSVAFAAVNLARQIFGDLSERTAFMIGAGDTIELTARHLHEQGLSRLIIANRSLPRAQTLASQFSGYAIGLDAVPEHLAEADIVVASTASSAVVVHADTVGDAIRKRKHRPMLIVDLAVPRDIAPAAGELEDIYLYSIDDLQQIVQTGLQSRTEAAQQAREIIANATEHFSTWLLARTGVNMIRDYRAQAHHIRAQTLAQARRRLHCGHSIDDTLDFLANTLTNRLIHTPTMGLRTVSESQRADLIEAARELLQPADPSASDDHRS